MFTATRMKGWSLGSGRAATCAADQLLEITLVWVVWQATESSTYTSIAAFAQRAPFWLLGFVGAGYVDRIGPVRMLRNLNVLSFLIALLGLGLVTLLGREALVIAVVSFLIGVARAMEAPALTSLVPGFVGVWSVQGLNNLLDNAKRLGRLLAPAPALLLGAVPAHLMLGLCSCGYLVMGLVARTLARGSQGAAEGNPALSDTPTPPDGAGFLASARRIYASGQLGVVLGASVLYAFFHGAAYFAVMPRVLLSESGGAVGAYASIVSAFGFGGMFANLLIARASVHRYAQVLALGMLGAGLAFLMIGQVQGMLLLWIVGFVGGMSLPLQEVFLICLIQRDAPKAMLARTHAVWRLGCEAGLGLGMLLGGLAADQWNGALLLALAGSGIMLIAAFVFLQDRKAAS